MGSDPRVEEYNSEHQDRNELRNLDISEVFAYFNEDDGAPSAQEVFDHYWSILEYALSDSEKNEIRAMTPEGGVERLLALGGIIDAYITIDLITPYEYSREDLGLEDEVNEFRFLLPKCPIDLLRAGVLLGRDVSENILEQHELNVLRSVLVYKGEDLVDIMTINTAEQSIEIPLIKLEEEPKLNHEILNAEDEWAKIHSLKYIHIMKVTAELHMHETASKKE